MNNQFTDSATIAGTRRTNDGYLVAEVRCARTGCQDYAGADFGMMDGKVTVYRPESAVFAKESLATFAGKPVTVAHPPEMVTADNWKTYAVGDIGTDIARDGEYVRVQIKVMDAAAIKAIEDGTKEISMGYTTPVAMQDGVAPDGTPYQAVQTGPIRINHLAIVPRARGGSNLRIGDGADHWGASPLTVADKKEDKMSDALRKIMVDGLQVETTDAGATAIEKLIKKVADMAADMTEAEKKAKAEADKTEAEMAKKDAEIADLKAKTLDATALDALVKTRADLVGKAKAIAPDVKIDGLADAAIRKAVVVAKRGDAFAAKSDAYIDAAFDLLAETVDSEDPAKSALADGGAKVTDLTAVYTARDQSLSDAWKAPVQKGA